MTCPSMSKWSHWPAVGARSPTTTDTLLPYPSSRYQLSIYLLYGIYSKVQLWRAKWLAVWNAILATSAAAFLRHFLFNFPLCIVNAAFVALKLIAFTIALGHCTLSSSQWWVIWDSKQPIIFAKWGSYELVGGTWIWMWMGMWTPLSHTSQWPMTFNLVAKCSPSATEWTICHKHDPYFMVFRWKTIQRSHKQKTAKQLAFEWQFRWLFPRPHIDSNTDSVYSRHRGGAGQVGGQPRGSPAEESALREGHGPAGQPWHLRWEGKTTSNI